MDTFRQLAQQRGLPVDAPAAVSRDWTSAREMVRRHGLRNGALTAYCSLDKPAGIAGLSHGSRRAQAGAQWRIECAARRQKWIDMGQTLMVPAPEQDVAKIAALCMQAWEKGLKTAPQFRPAALAEPLEEPAARHPVEKGVMA
jgi:ribonucleotide reductase alpha subunit